MIKNAKQAALTRIKQDEIRAAKAKLEVAANIDEEPLRKRAALSSLSAIIADLEAQLVEYNDLINQNTPYLCNKTLEQLSKILISARLAQRLSHKELAKRLSITEQQVQRYESTDYESASLVKLLDVMDALNLKLQFKDIAILDADQVKFELPEGIDLEKITKYEAKVKQDGSLLLQ